MTLPPKCTTTIRTSTTRTPLKDASTPGSAPQSTPAKTPAHDLPIEITAHKTPETTQLMVPTYTDIARVNNAIQEAYKPANVMLPLMTDATDDASRQHNAHMRTLYEARQMPGRPSICVCQVLKPSDLVMAMLKGDTPLRLHARDWTHFFHCVRASEDDVWVFRHMTQYCVCAACLYHVEIFRRAAMGEAQHVFEKDEET